MMKSLILTVYTVFVCCRLNAETNAWQPSPEHTQVPIWPGAVPDPQPVAGPESLRTLRRLVAGRPWVSVGNVSQPTMTVYSPKELMPVLR